ncbi:hypothetical protein S83_016443 [Arachis hypogaea]
MLVRWVPPSKGAIKLNVDGSSRGNAGRAGCGGLLRDQDGNCIAGFVSYIGFAGSVEAELIAIRHGLWLAWQSGYRKVECESDCMMALKIIQDNAEDFPEFAHIVEEIHRFMLLEWDVTIYHIMREGNSCADFLAKIGSSSNSMFSLIISPQPELTPLLVADSKGVLILEFSYTRI